MTILVHDQMQLVISRPAGDEATYVQVSGDVGITNARTLGLAARQLMEVAAAVTYVDLAGVTLLGSALVGFLVQIGASCGASGGALVLCRPSPAGLRTIRGSGLDQFADLRPDLPPAWPS